MSSLPIIIDNGSYEIKFGTSDLKSPYRALNAMAKDKYNNIYLSNQIKNIKDISSVQFRRPHELGQLLSWELQSSIWDYCLYNPDNFNGFDLNKFDNKDLIVSETCFTIPQFSKHLSQVVFEEYEFDSLFTSSIAGFVPFANLNNKKKFSQMLSVSGKDDVDPNQNTITDSNISYNNFQFIIDSGFNCTWFIPVIKGIPYYKAVKKMDIGGRFLNGLLKEALSFRHYDVTDETILVNNIKEKCLFIAPRSYSDSFKSKKNTSLEYILPDFHTSFLGYIKESNTKVPENSQIISLQDELFAVPETIFHPEISNILKPGIVETFLESIYTLPESIRPLMVNNIICTGGNFNLPNFATRLVDELQRQLPTDWTCNITFPKEDAELFGWQAMSDFSKTDNYLKVRVSKEEYYEHGPEWCTKNRFGYQNWM